MPFLWSRSWHWQKVKSHCLKFETTGLKHWLIWFDEQDKTNDNEEMESYIKIWEFLEQIE